MGIKNKLDREFDIPFEGLKRGKHLFEYQLTTAFFEKLPESVIQGGEAKVIFTLDKKETLMIGDFEITGNMQLPCNRCNKTVTVPIIVEHQVYYKFGNGESGSDDLIMIPDFLFSINISSSIYELLVLALPARIIHKKRECDPEMLDLLNRYANLSNDDEQEQITDARWNELNKLKN